MTRQYLQDYLFVTATDLEKNPSYNFTAINSGPLNALLCHVLLFADAHPDVVRAIQEKLDRRMLVYTIGATQVSKIAPKTG